MKETNQQVPVASGEPRPEGRDSVLVKQAQKGDRKAFNALIEQYHKAIVNFIYRNINDGSRAEELAQKVFVRCYLNIKQYNQQYKFSTWLYTIAVNLCKNELRDKSRRPRNVELTDLIRTPDVTSASPVKALADKEIREKVSRAVQSLPEDQRQAIIMSVYNDLPYKEIAEALKTNENTVKSWIFRGKQTLFEMLKGYVNQNK
ncbi:MAG TPA: RNA polymerase sigma factor [Planctomycetota bacterium]|nr:RNA polymerase sigma factor [Planctomycetota bacterium]